MTKLTKNQEAFINSTFKTKYGNTLTVVDFNGLAPNKAARFTVECDVCSKDKELFPRGSITAFKKQLQDGICMCACGGNCKWSEEQQIVRIRRKCKELNYEFLGWYEGYRGSHTKLSLYNRATDNYWNSTTLFNFVNRSSLDPVVTKSRGLTEDQLIAGYLHSCGNPSGVTIERAYVKGKTTYWRYFCEKCSQDEISLAGLCDGNFYTTGSNLLKGKLPCRCSEHHVYTEEQNQYIVKMIIERLHGVFIRWTEGYHNRKSKVTWVCENGHVNEQPMSGLVQGYGCRTCAYERNAFESGMYGYYKNRRDETDFLYIMQFNGEQTIIKIGRTLEEGIKTRKRHLIAASGIEDVKVLSTFTGSHHLVWHTEFAIHEVLRSLGLQYKCNWTREGFIEAPLDLIYELLENSPLNLIEDDREEN